MNIANKPAKKCPLNLFLRRKPIYNHNANSYLQWDIIDKSICFHFDLANTCLIEDMLNGG